MTLLSAVSTLPGAGLDNVQDDGHGLGWLGGLVVVGLVVVSIGLFLAMRRSLGKVTFEEKDTREQ